MQRATKVYKDMFLRENGIIDFRLGRNHMRKYPLIVKCSAFGIILLFIGVAVAPSINSSVVKASNGNDLIEVTSQACGIQGFGNTTVKLTKEQYQNLEQYLIDFRARLNQTTTKEEAVPLFKEAVVELNKYGLLPKGMSIDKAQKLVLGGYQNPLYTRFLGKIETSQEKNYSDDENYLCLIAGLVTNTISLGPILTGLEFVSVPIALFFINLSVYFSQHNNQFLSFFYLMLANLFVPFLIMQEFGLGNFISNINPILVLSTIGLGGFFIYGSTPSLGWIGSYGLNGAKIWAGRIYGDLNTFYMNLLNIRWFYGFVSFFPGILGFLGIKIGIPILGSFYLGGALEIKIVQ